MKILITGSAGFIGYHLSNKMISSKKNLVVGIDNLNNYYDLSLKKKRIKSIKNKSKKNFFFIKTDISNFTQLEKIFKKYKFDIVVNLAAQAGVRYSLKNPEAYLKSNLIGFFNILELSKKYKIKHLVSASTSSVYGRIKKLPLKVSIPADEPIQFYAATKRSNEIMGYSYSELYKMRITMIRFFTVYGPWGRPDMSYFLFVKNILENRKINVFNYGKHQRDFTHVYDIVEGIKLVVNKKTSKNTKKFNIINLCRGKKITLINFINIIEKYLNKKSKIRFMEMQKGDIENTLGDISETKKFIRFKPKINFKEGVKSFVDWYKSYYLIKK